MGVPAILALAGTAIQAKGAADEGEAQANAANANARLAKMDADNEQERIRRASRIVRSRNITRIAKSGVELSGSPLDVLFSNEMEAQRQVGAIARSQRAYESIQNKIADAARESARWRIAGSVISGAGSALGGSGLTFSRPAGGDTGWGPSGSGKSLGLYQPNFDWRTNGVLSTLKPGAV